MYPGSSCDAFTTRELVLSSVTEFGGCQLRSTVESIYFLLSQENN